jgi:hypothetical protein
MTGGATLDAPMPGETHHAADRGAEPVAGIGLTEREIVAGVKRLRALATRNRDAGFFYELVRALLDPANDVEELLDDIRAVYFVADSEDEAPPLIE